MSKRWEPAGHLFWTLCQPYWEESSAVSVLSWLLVSDSFRRIWHWEVDVAKNLGYVKEPHTAEHSSTKITRQVHDRFYDDLWISILIPMMTANTRTCVGPVKLSAWRSASPQMEDSWQWKCIALVTTCVKVDKSWIILFILNHYDTCYHFMNKLYLAASWKLVLSDSKWTYPTWTQKNPSSGCDPICLQSKPSTHSSGMKLISPALARKDCLMFFCTPMTLESFVHPRFTS